MEVTKAKEEKAVDSKQPPLPDVTRQGSVEIAEITEAQYQHADEALGFVEKHAGFTYTPEQDKAVLRKIDRHLMPLMFISYLIQFLDKSVMAQSLIYGLTSNLHLVGQQYSWCGSAFYFGYLAFQPFSSRLLNFVPLGKFVSVTSLCWAIILFCTAGAKNFSGLFAARFFLGMSEGGISPAYVLISGMWYKKDEIPQRVTFWFMGNGVAIIIQSFLAYGIGHIDKTSIATWCWFFIIYGIFGLIWAVTLFFCMPDSPLTARFLSEEEKMIAVERLRDNRTGIANKEFKKYQLVEALKDPLVYYSFFYAITCVVPNSGVSFFGSLIVNGFGFTPFVSSLLQVPFGATECIALLGAGYITRRWANLRCINQFIWIAPSVIGAALVYYLPETNKVGRLISFYLTTFSNAALPLQFSMVTSNIAGHTKRATGNAVIFLGYATGFIIGPQFFLASESPRYPTGFKTMMITFLISCLAPLGLYTWFGYLNLRKRRALAAMGGEDHYATNEEFLDLTDREQIHFVYSK